MKKQISLLFLSVFFMLSLHAQDSTLTRDFETWYSIGAEKKLMDKKLTLGFNQQFRLDNNAGRLYQFFSDFSGDYEIYKNLELGVGYRFIRDGNKTKVTEHRFNADVNYKQKMDRLRIAYRLRYQVRSNGEFSGYSTTKYRFRLKLNYNIKGWKLDPYLSSELFFTKDKNPYNYIDEVTEIQEISKFQKYRIQLGTSFKTGDVGTIKLFYMLEHQFKDYGTNYGIPINWNIIGVNYTFKL